MENWKTTTISYHFYQNITLVIQTCSQKLEKYIETSPDMNWSYKIACKLKKIRMFFKHFNEQTNICWFCYYITENELFNSSDQILKF